MSRDMEEDLKRLVNKECAEMTGRRRAIIEIAGLLVASGMAPSSAVARAADIYDDYEAKKKSEGECKDGR